MQRIIIPCFITCFLSITLLGQGCNTQTSSPDTQPLAQPTEQRSMDKTNEENTGIAMQDTEHQQSIYEDFTKAKYQAALDNNEPIFLFFHANWCPTCKEQEPRNQKVLQNYDRFVHGFRLNILDTEVDADEDALAKQFNVVRQHTAIFIDSNGQEVKRTIGTQTNPKLTEALDLISK